MNFNATLEAEKLKYLKTIIDTTANIVSGPRTFRFTPDGIIFESMDQGSVFVYFNIAKSFFQTFDLTDILELRVNIDDLKKVLTRVIGKDEVLTMNFFDSNKFGINFGKATGFGKKRKYELALHNPDEEERRNIAEIIKSIPLSAHITLQPGSFSEILSDVGIAGEKDAKHLIVNMNKSLVKFEINRGSEGMNAEVELPFAENMKLEEDEVKSSYDMEYLDKLTKLDPLSANAQFELGNDKPLRITFKISNDIEFIFVMAPLVDELEEDDDEEFEEE